MFLDNLMRANEAENVFVCLLCVSVTSYLIILCIQCCGCSPSQFCPKRILQRSLKLCFVIIAAIQLIMRQNTKKLSIHT